MQLAHRPAVRQAKGRHASQDSWTTAEFTTVREALLGEGRRLQSEILAARTRLSSAASILEFDDDEVGFASHAAERDRELLTLDNVQQLLEQTDDALRRVDDGLYPTCDDCGGLVGKRRQQAFPRARTCLECKRRQEQS